MALPFINNAGGSINRNELISLIEKQTNQHRTTVSRHITALVEAGKLIENDKIISVATVPDT